MTRPAGYPSVVLPSAPETRLVALPPLVLPGLWDEFCAAVSAEAEANDRKLCARLMAQENEAAMAFAEEHRRVAASRPPHTASDF